MVRMSWHSGVRKYAASQPSAVPSARQNFRHSCSRRKDSLVQQRRRRLRRTLHTPFRREDSLQFSLISRCNALERLVRRASLYLDSRESPCSSVLSLLSNRSSICASISLQNVSEASCRTVVHTWKRAVGSASRMLASSSAFGKMAKNSRYTITRSSGGRLRKESLSSGFACAAVDDVALPASFRVCRGR